jgi:hypothetical protein
MDLLRDSIRQATEQTRMDSLVIEKDYALSYVLAGLATQPILTETLIFKGGTALKKYFFGNYRFSEDLDFSAIDGPAGNELENALGLAVNEAVQLLQPQGQFELAIERYKLRNPHPEGQEAFKVRVTFPWYRRPFCKIKIEIAPDELVLVRPESRPLIHGYDEDLVVNTRCYCLEEVVVEKMRTILQGYQFLLERNWVRPRGRHYYDLWRIFGEYGHLLQRDNLLDMLRTKSAHRNVSFTSLDDFFPEELVSDVKRTWEASLGRFVPGELPSCEEVLGDLRSVLPSFFPALA